MVSLVGISKLRERIDVLQKEYGMLESVCEVDIQKLIEIAKVRVEWQDPRIWNVYELGEACMIPSRAGFIVRIPGLDEDYSDPWKRFVLGHEIGHTLFFDKKDLGGDYRMKLRQDIWIDAKEEICDEISDVLLMPTLECSKKENKLESVYNLAKGYNVPVDRAFRRWLSLNPTYTGTNKASPYLLSLEEPVAVDIPF